jgi:hypothetical protein
LERPAIGLTGWVRVVSKPKNIVLVGLEVQVEAHIVRVLGSPVRGVKGDLFHIFVVVGVSWLVSDVGGGGSLTLW